MYLPSIPVHRRIAAEMCRRSWLVISRGQGQALRCLFRSVSADIGSSQLALSFFCSYRL